MISMAVSGVESLWAAVNIIGGVSGFGFNLIMAERGGAECFVSFSHEMKPPFKIESKFCILKKFFGELHGCRPCKK